MPGWKMFCIWTAIGLSFPLGAKAESRVYVPLGDSYTRGEGVSPEESFPAQLTRRLNETGVPVQLGGNPAESGWTTQDLMDQGLSKFEKLRPGFSTLLIGVNDWLQGASNREFSYRLKKVLDAMQAVLPPHRLILISIPDFSCSPDGSRLGFGRSAPNGMKRLNRVLKAEAEERGLPWVDIFPLSQQACREPAAMYAQDHFHPSAQQYSLWVEAILPVAQALLRGEK